MRSGDGAAGGIAADRVRWDTPAAAGGRAAERPKAQVTGPAYRYLTKHIRMRGHELPEGLC